MDNCLLQMVRDGLIDAETAVDAAADEDYVRQNTGMAGLGGMSARPQGGMNNSANRPQGGFLGRR